MPITYFIRVKQTIFCTMSDFSKKKRMYWRNFTVKETFKGKVSYPIIQQIQEISGRKINSYERNLFQIPH